MLSMRKTGFPDERTLMRPIAHKEESLPTNPSVKVVVVESDSDNNPRVKAADSGHGDCQFTETESRSRSTDQTGASLYSDRDIRNLVIIGKLAVALVIIRQRPAGQSGQQHAETLCGQFRSTQLHLQEQNDKLRAELLLLRQAQVLASLAPTQTQAVRKSADTGRHGIFGTNIRDPPAPISDEITVLTPPSSSEAMHDGCILTADDTAKRHCHFLQSVLAVRRASSTGMLSDSSVNDTVVAALRLITHWLTQPDHHGLSYPIIDHITDSVLALCSPCHQDGASKQYTLARQEILHLIQALISSVMNFDPLKSICHQESLCSLLHKFCCYSSLQMAALELLLTCIKEYSDVLRAVARQQMSFSAIQFENSCHILRTLEALVKCAAETNKNDSVWKVYCQSVNQQLEDSLLYIADDFPLFAVYIWRIGGLLHTVSHTHLTKERDSNV